jgi:hypothetical protein
MLESVKQEVQCAAACTGDHEHAPEIMTVQILQTKKLL